MWGKIIGIFVILLFFGAGVLPCMSANLLNINNTNNTLYNVITDVFFIGLITDRTEYYTFCSFMVIIGYLIVYYDDEVGVAGSISKIKLEYHFDNKTGYFGKHVVCAKFFDIY